MGLHSYDAHLCIIAMERYRSGHNGADSKSVCAKAHGGSNPPLSAKKRLSRTQSRKDFLAAFKLNVEKGLAIMRKTILVVLFLLFLFSLSSCNDNKSDMVFSVEPPCLDHKFGDWAIITEPTTKAEGLKQRVCQNCGFFENEKIPKNTVSYSINENGNKVLEVKIPGYEDNEDLTPSPY